MTTKIIGIAGGSGSGKSTLAVSLCKKYPDQFALLQLDDYFKSKADAPVLGQFVNWEHPDAIRWNDLIRDITDLKAGKSVTISTKSELYNPEYDWQLKNKINYIVEPKQLILIEGYLVFAYEQLRALCDMKIYLDISIEQSLKRRSANKFAPEQAYVEQVLLPMHEQYVAPTKNYADIVIDAGTHSTEAVFDMVAGEIFK